jgi:hypothetical protein
MKSIWTFFILGMIAPAVYETPIKESCTSTAPLPVAENIFIITTDGFRWQEVFGGADSIIINAENFTPDTSTMKMLYWAATPEERR